MTNQCLAYAFALVVAVYRYWGQEKSLYAIYKSQATEENGTNYLAIDFRNEVQQITLVRLLEQVIGQPTNQCPFAFPFGIGKHRFEELHNCP
nr:hypothetical protein [Symmachiella dynata]